MSVSTLQPTPLRLFYKDGVSPIPFAKITVRLTQQITPKTTSTIPIADIQTDGNGVVNWLFYPNVRINQPGIDLIIEDLPANQTHTTTQTGGKLVLPWDRPVPLAIIRSTGYEDAASFLTTLTTNWSATKGTGPFVLELIRNGSPAPEPVHRPLFATFSSWLNAENFSTSAAVNAHFMKIRGQGRARILPKLNGVIGTNVTDPIYSTLRNCAHAAGDQYGSPKTLEKIMKALFEIFDENPPRFLIRNLEEDWVYTGTLVYALGVFLAVPELGPATATKRTKGSTVTFSDYPVYRTTVEIDGPPRPLIL